MRCVPPPLNFMDIDGRLFVDMEDMADEHHVNV